NKIYYYFDDKILTKLPVIESFSRLKGEKPKGFVWVSYLRGYDPKNKILAVDGARIDLAKATIHTAEGVDRFGALYIHDGEKVIQSRKFRNDSYAIIIYKNRYVIGVYNYLQSLFFQAFFFDNLDKRLFKTLHYDKDAKIFELVGR
ncbi:MAG: hypothetical protein C6H99_06045, partial [Epsilonproteobacteria bacterium]|nr:hypothetical protein [Campylobacterota bacterium]NPA64456.1 hypothetical protein [Campylobacterota bacterium]